MKVKVMFDLEKTTETLWNVSRKKCSQMCFLFSSLESCGFGN